MTILEAKKAVQTLLGTTPDGIGGPKTNAAFATLFDAKDDNAPWLPVAPAPAPSGSPDGTILRGDGTWKWTAEIDGLDIVVRNAVATCFGGDSDPQDNGETASGINTKGNPNLIACSLPMDGRQFPHMTPAEHAALDGSPIPKVPWKTIVRVQDGATVHDFPVIELGPGRRTGHQLDLTIAAARLFDPNATATNCTIHCDYRIIGGAAFVNG